MTKAFLRVTGQGREAAGRPAGTQFCAVGADGGPRKRRGVLHFREAVTPRVASAEGCREDDGTGTLRGWLRGSYDAKAASLSGRS